MTILLPITVFITIVISLIFGIILLTIESYADGLKISKGKVSYKQTLIMNIKQMIQNNINRNNEIIFSDFLLKLLTLTVSVYLVTTVLIVKTNLEYSFLALSTLYLVYTYTNNTFFQKEYTLEANLKNFISQLVLLIANFTLSYMLLSNVDVNFFALTFFKIIAFLNFSLIIYQINRIGKKTRDIENAVFSKIIFVISYFSLFLYINSFSQKMITPIKIFYYLMSMFLVEFIASYIKKNITKFSVEKSIMYNIEGQMRYFVGVYIIMLGVCYAL